MAKILQGNLPQKINVIVNRERVAVAVFDENGIYETNNPAVIKELERYGYKVEKCYTPTEVKQIVEEVKTEIKEAEPVVKKKTNTKANNRKKKHESID